MQTLTQNRPDRWSRVIAWVRDTLGRLPSGYDDCDPLVFRAMPPF